MAEKTIIDILRKGNLELFHSAMIAWLLDPDGEHGLGPQFVRGFAERLAERGEKQLLNWISSSEIDSVQTETSTYRSRYDITLRVGGKLAVIENKAKSVGAVPQFERYGAEAALLIPLGLCDASFRPEVQVNHRLLTYGDILVILENIHVPDRGAFAVLIEEYRRFLHRELSILALVDECFAEGALHRHEALTELLSKGREAKYYTDNDIRFLNLYYLEKLRRHLGRHQLLKGTEWDSDKNMRSGVWLSNHEGPVPGYDFSPAITALLGTDGSKLWFHIELNCGVETRDLNQVAGAIQLKCYTPRSNRELAAALKSVFVPTDGMYLSSRVSDAWNTFYLLGSNIAKSDMVFAQMPARLLDFMRAFGQFEQSAP